MLEIQSSVDRIREKITSSISLLVSPVKRDGPIHSPEECVITCRFIRMHRYTICFEDSSDKIIQDDQGKKT
jgi:hypothetical protein